MQDWVYYKDLPITNGDTVPLFNYQIKVTLTKANFPTSNTYFQDLRFVSTTGDVCSHWLRNDASEPTTGTLSTETVNSQPVIISNYRTVK